MSNRTGLTNAQKHELLIMHQKERADANDLYQEEKKQ